MLITSSHCVHYYSIQGVYTNRQTLVTSLACTDIRSTGQIVRLTSSKAGSWNSTFDSISGFNIIMLSYNYRKSHCGDKAIGRPSCLHNGISYTVKTSSLYWIGPLMSFSSCHAMGVSGISIPFPDFLAFANDHKTCFFFKLHWKWYLYVMTLHYKMAMRIYLFSYPSTSNLKKKQKNYQLKIFLSITYILMTDYHWIL